MHSISMRITYIACFFFLLVASFSLFAHQQKEAYTTIKFNKESSLLQVTHRFLLHDAEHITQALKLSDAQSALDLTLDESVQNEFTNYVLQHFALANQDGTAIELKLLGYEAEGKYFWVYQETELPNTKVVNLKHSSFIEFWPTQVNHINVEHGGNVYSVRLTKEDVNRWQSIELLE